jgi:hypothetical protein
MCLATRGRSNAVDEIKYGDVQRLAVGLWQKVIIRIVELGIAASAVVGLAASIGDGGAFVDFTGINYAQHRWGSVRAPSITSAAAGELTGQGVTNENGSIRAGLYVVGTTSSRSGAGGEAAVHIGIAGYGGSIGADLHVMRAHSCIGRDALAPSVRTLRLA